MTTCSAADCVYENAEAQLRDSSSAAFYSDARRRKTMTMTLTMMMMMLCGRGGGGGGLDVGL